MKLNKTKIIDERQERQNLENSNIAFNAMIMMLLVGLLAQTFFLQRGFAYIGPEFIALLGGCILKIILDIRQGNLYTKGNSKTSLVMLLYGLTALGFAVLMGIRNYMLYDFALWKISFVIIPIFAEMFVLFIAVHFIYVSMAKRRLRKIEKELEKDEFEE